MNVADTQHLMNVLIYTIDCIRDHRNAGTANFFRSILFVFCLHFLEF